MRSDTSVRGPSVDFTRPRNGHVDPGADTSPIRSRPSSSGAHRPCVGAAAAGVGRCAAQPDRLYTMPSSGRARCVRMLLHLAADLRHFLSAAPWVAERRVPIGLHRALLWRIGNTGRRFRLNAFGLQTASVDVVIGDRSAPVGCVSRKPLPSYVNDRSRCSRIGHGSRVSEVTRQAPR